MSPGHPWVPQTTPIYTADICSRIQVYSHAVRVYMARVTARGAVYIPTINSATNIASLLNNTRPSGCKN